MQSPSPTPQAGDGMTELDDIIPALKGCFSLTEHYQEQVVEAIKTATGTSGAPIWGTDGLIDRAGQYDTLTCLGAAIERLRDDLMVRLEGVSRTVATGPTALPGSAPTCRSCLLPKSN